MKRVNCTTEMPFTELPLLVNTYDIDIAGHVNNIVFIRWLEDMRNKLFAQMYSLQELLALDFYLVVVSCEIKYKKQIKIFDGPVGKIFLKSYSHGVFVFNAEITIEHGIAFTAIQKCVLLNLTDNKMFIGNIKDLIK